MTSNEISLDLKAKKVEWSKDTCDKYDYLIATFCGAAAGIIDIFFVGTPGMSKLCNSTDVATDEMVKKFAKMTGWKPKFDNENNVGSAIGFFERNFKVNYENTSTKSVGGRFQMSTKNHHYKSLAHSPDIIGLFFSILDQFTNTASFLSDGKLIRIDTSETKFELRGSNFVAKLFCGFCNWIGHIMSDIAGSSGSRSVGSTGRGTGLPIPFYNLFLLCDFGKFQVGKDRKTLAEIMTRAFQEGYDVRFGTAMAIPVLIEELMIRVIWSIKRHYYLKKDWKECIPIKEHADLRIMLLVGNCTLCVIDGVDAVIRSGGNAVTFLLHMNLIAWARLLMLIFRELRIRYGSNVDWIVNKYLAELGLNDKIALQQYYNRMNLLHQRMEQLLKDFIVEVEKEYNQFLEDMDKSLNLEIGTPKTRRNASIRFAEHHRVDNSRIIRNEEQMRYWLSNGRK